MGFPMIPNPMNPILCIAFTSMSPDRG